MTRCCHGSCPEIVPVTVTQTIIQIDDAPMLSRNQRVTYSSSSLASDKKTITLDFTPYEARSVSMAKNSGVQRWGVDFTVLGNLVVLNTALIEGDEVFFNYISVTGVTAVNTAAVGSITHSASTDMTDQGYLLMDGSTPHDKATYADLWTFLQAHSELYVSASSTGDDFVLTSLLSTYYDGTSLVTLRAHIKATA